MYVYSVNDFLFQMAVYHCMFIGGYSSHPTFSAISTLSGGITSICSNSSSRRFSMFVSICKVLWVQSINSITIQHIDTLPKYGKKKLSMYVGPHDVYPTMYVNFSILTRECKNKTLLDNISLQTLFCYQCAEL